MTRLVRVPSLTTPGAAYEIHRLASGALLCTCPAYDHSPPPAKTCKHVAIYEAALHALQRCVAAHGTDGTAVCAQCLVDVLTAAAVKVRRRYVPREQVEAVRERAAAKVLDMRERLRDAKRRRRKRG